MCRGLRRNGEIMRRKEFARVTPEEVGIDSREIDALLDRLEREHTQMHGIMIMRHGKICAEGWWSPYAPGLRHGLQSLTKTWAATAVGIAYTEGLLKLEDRIIDIFPEEAPDMPEPLLTHLRVRDVLCMGCGMEKMPAPTKNWIRDFLHIPVVHEPGTAFMYNSMGSTLLGAVVRKLTGLGLHDYLKPRLFDKIGVDADNLRWFHMPDGMEVGGGGLFAATEDNLRLMKLYLDGGMWEGERILAEDYVKLATSCQNDSSTEILVNPPAADNFLGYGFQIWMCKPQGVYRADGAMGQFSICCPAQDMIISVNETAIGADMGCMAEAEHYVKEVASGNQAFALTSCCPSWSVMAKMLFPETIDKISNELTPMVATARVIKQEHPHALVVFIGPCASKKLEASRRTVRSDVDFVITFEELAGMFEARGILLEEIAAMDKMQDATGAGRGYGVAGGVASAIEDCIKTYYPSTEVKIEHAEGLSECRKMLLLAKAGRKNGCLIEGMACPGGCIAGAGTNIPIPQAAKEVARFKAAAKDAVPEA